MTEALWSGAELKLTGATGDRTKRRRGTAGLRDSGGVPAALLPACDRLSGMANINDLRLTNLTCLYFMSVGMSEQKRWSVKR